jgi:hypothetical protein
MNFPSPALTLAHFGDLKSVWREISPVTPFSSPFKSFSEESLEDDGFGSSSVGRGWECQRLPGREKKGIY